MKKAIIFASTASGGFGNGGKLPWPRIKDDSRYFFETTTLTSDPKKQNACIMGRKTWESIPETNRPLSGRINIVLTKEAAPDVFGSDTVYFMQSVTEALAFCELLSVETAFFIGGVDVIAKALERTDIDAVYHTLVKADHQSDREIDLSLMNRFILCEEKSLTEVDFRIFRPAAITE